MGCSHFTVYPDPKPGQVTITGVCKWCGHPSEGLTNRGLDLQTEHHLLTYINKGQEGRMKTHRRKLDNVRKPIQRMLEV